MDNEKYVEDDKKTTRKIRRKTILSFAILFIGFSLAIFGWQWINRQPKENEQPKPLRTLLRINEKVNKTIFSKTNLAKEYPKSAAAKNVRVNGSIGLGENFDPEEWRLYVSRHPDGDSTLIFEMKDIKSFPKRDVIFDFKCIEGWSQVTHWGGTRFSDFIQQYHLGTHSGKAPDLNHPEDLYKYVGLMTPDKQYYVGIDMKSMMQSQTLLCYEMNEKALPLDQGYPLRLIITVKYGIKKPETHRIYLFFGYAACGLLARTGL